MNSRNEEKTNKRRLGGFYEARAAAYLRRAGLDVLEQNYRCRSGEIDLIARDRGTLVFVEVKYRRDASRGLPEEAISARKQQTIMRVAQYYCMTHHVPDDVPCRFDVIAIEKDALRHYAGAFP